MVLALVYIVKLMIRKEPLSVGFISNGQQMIAKKPSDGVPDNGLAVGPAVDLRGRHSTISPVYENLCGGMDAQCTCDGNETI